MKTGIMTLHYIPNYGAVLQSYALKVVLNRYCDADIIDYRQCNREKNFSMKVYLKSAIFDMNFKDIIKFPLHCYRSRYHVRFRRILSTFYKQKLEIKNQVHKKELNNLDRQYEGIVVGSDQVWNPKVLAGEYSLMLDFYHNKKYSYASSIGVTVLPNNEIENYRKNLQQFRFVSCREKAGAEIINQLFLNDKCESVLDPTLLLTKKEWILCGANSNMHSQKKYVLVYMARYDTNILDLAEKIGLKTGLEIVYIATPAVRSKMPFYKKCLYRITPEEWLGYFNSAELILTNSFHGIAFSINSFMPALTASQMLMVQIQEWKIYWKYLNCKIV
jgi:hypothetical protein